MDVKTLYTLVAVADRGSFAEAAAAVGLSLPAVSQQMRALEDELDTSLFDRSRRPPVLTEAGVEFTRRARELLAQWEGMSEALRREGSGGLLKLGAVHTAVSGVLPLALGLLREQGRALDIHLTTGLTHELERAVFRRQLDAAITTQPELVRPELRFEPFADEPFVVITHRSTPAAADRKILESTPYVRFNRSARVGALVHDALARRKIAVRSVMEIDTLEGVVAMVANGLGSSVVPARGVDGEFPASVRAVPFGSPPLTRRIGLLSSRDAARQHLCDMLLEALRSASRSPLQARGTPRKVARGQAGSVSSRRACGS